MDNQDKMKRINITIDKTTLREMDKQAKKEKLKRSAYIRKMVDEKRLDV